MNRYRSVWGYLSWLNNMSAHFLCSKILCGQIMTNITWQRRPQEKHELLRYPLWDHITICQTNSLFILLCPVALFLWFSKHQEIPGVAYTCQIIVLWHMLNDLIIVKVCLSLYRYEFINSIHEGFDINIL